MKFSIVSLSSSQRAEFEGLAAQVGVASGYSWLEPAQLPTAIPAALRAKMPAALLMWDRSPSGFTFLVCNGVRYDAKAGALDQEPFGVAVSSSGAGNAGIFAHHGRWAGRTAELASSVSGLIASSSLWDYYPFSEVPSTASGPFVGSSADLSRRSIPHHRGPAGAAQHVTSPQEVAVKPVAECTTSELQEFEALVRGAGKVAEEGLPALIRSARVLAFVRMAGSLVAVGALKRPRPSYKAKVFQSARADAAHDAYPEELGWVSVSPQRQGSGLGTRVVENLLSAAEGRLYATTQSDNSSMQKILQRFGFRRHGAPYAGRDDELVLYLFDAGERTASP